MGSNDKETGMIFGKLWAAFRAQLNKIANFFYHSDPIAAMQYEYDKAVQELKQGREGLEQYRGLVETVGRQQVRAQHHVTQLEAQVKAYLKAGERDTAAKFAMELQKAKAELEQTSANLKAHEEAYTNNLKKIKHANEKLLSLRERIQKYDAELKMSAAEAEIAKLTEVMDINLTTDFGELENIIQRRIDANRGKARVAMDLSSKGMAEIEAEERVQAAMAEDALRAFEVELGLVSPETTPMADTSKDLGPAVADTHKDLGPLEQTQEH